MAMPANRKWLVLPPAVALLIVLGPLSMRTADASAEKPTPGPVAAPAATPTTQGPGTDSRTQPLPLPKSPDLWQITSTLLGVLLLGGASLMVLRKLRAAPATSGTGTVALRQTLRVSARAALHAVEFDGKMLLVGSSDRGLVLLHAANPQADAAEDERTIAARSKHVDVDDEDEGAVPKNLVIPRPTTAPARRTPTAPAAPATPAMQSAGARTLMDDFRTLLAKAGR